MSAHSSDGALTSGLPDANDSWPMELSLLGTPAVRCWRGDRTEVLRLPPRLLALLACLALTESRSGYRRDRLLALLWAESDDRRGRNALRQALYELRRAIGRKLLSDPGSENVRLNRDLVGVDAQRFLSAAKAGRHDEAIRLYAGPLLEGLQVKGAPEFMEWLDRTREQHAKWYAKCLEGLAGKCERQQQWDEATEWCTRILAVDRLNVRAALTLVRCQAAGGDPAGALRWAESFATTFQCEIGMYIAPQLQEALTEGCRLASWQSPHPPGDRTLRPERIRSGHALLRFRPETAVLVLLSLALLASVVLG